MRSILKLAAVAVSLFAFTGAAYAGGCLGGHSTTKVEKPVVIGS